MTLIAAVYRTPFGALSVVTDQDLVVCSGFQPVAASLARLGGPTAGRGTQPLVAEAIEAYLDGDLDALTRVRTLQSGGPFAQAAWKAMTRVRAGRVISYAELAATAGSPRAVRAAGSACARNLVAPFVPCHRVIKTGGALGNYGYGVPIKQALLTFEGLES